MNDPAAPPSPVPSEPTSAPPAPAGQAPAAPSSEATGEPAAPGGNGEGPPAWPPPGDDPVAALEARLGQPLANRVTALAALTHKSYVNEHRGEALLDNERLEFLGDAVIDLAVSHRLMERFPAAREGDLSKMRAAVVDEQGLAAMARSIDLGALLRLGRGEELTGGRKKASLLADAMEAVVAAVYLEAGLAGVLRLVERFLGEAFARAAAGTLDRDYKTQLQELAQSRFKATPRYRVVAETGPDHAKVFVVELDLRGEALGRGSGRSKKDAEQAAARPALELLTRRCAAELAGATPAAAAAPEAEPAPGAAPVEPVSATPGAAAPEIAAPGPEAEEPTAAEPAVEPPEVPEPPGPPSPTQAAAQPPSMEGSVEPVVEAPPPAERAPRRKRAPSPKARRAKAPASPRAAAAARPGKPARKRVAKAAKPRPGGARRPTRPRR